MWQQEKKDRAIVSLALWLALATAPMTATLLVSAPMLAETATDDPTFPLPQTVDNGTTVRIDGSSSLAAINQSLKENFEKQFSGTKVEVGVNGTDAALKALLLGNIDVAAIPRGLTPEEQAQGLEQVRLHREKIAIIVSTENPFKGSLTSKQFARIFRGEIKDWSRLGAPKGQIRFIDRPTTSDTRNAFRDYPAFKTGEFATGSNATQLAEDNTAELVKQLGKDGISYVTANQVSKLQDVRVLQLHQTSPDDPKYPFSQPLVYVYKQNPSPSVAGFLGFTLAPPGQKAIEEARTAEASAIASSVLQKFTTANQPASLTETLPAAASPIETAPVATASPIETAPVATAPVTTAPVATVSPTETLPGLTNSPREQLVLPEENNPPMERDIPLWLLLPLFVASIGGILLWWFLKRRSLADGETDSLVESTANPSIAVTDDASNLFSLNNGNQTNGGSHLTESTTSNGANIVENITPNKSATLAGGSSILSAFAAKSSDPQVTNTTTVNSPAEIISLDSGEVAWDIEAPAAVVNTSYPQLSNISESASDTKLSTDEVADSLPELPDEETDSLSVLLDEPEDELNLELATVEETDSLSVLLDEPEDELNLELATVEETDSLSVLLDEPEDELNLELATVEETDSLSLLLDEPEDELNLELATDEETDSLSVLLDEPEDELNLELATDEETDSLSLLLDESEDESNLELATDSLSESLDEPEDELNLELAADEVTNSVSILLDELEDELNLELAADEVTNSDSVLLDEPEDELNLELATEEVTNSEFVLPDVLESGLNAVADEADTTADLTEKISQVVASPEKDVAKTASNRTEVTTEDAALAAGVSIGAWATVYGVNNNLELEVQGQTNTEESANLLDVNHASSNVVLTPRTPKWAYVSWYVSETQKKVLRQQGDCLLAVRLYDVTDIDLSYQSPQLIQQYECEEATHDRYVAIPAGDRDYMTEIGYVTNGDRWLCIARSATVRIFSRPRTDFWFVADTELIIHGATEIDAKVTIGGHPIKLKPDGTFHLRIPFSDKLIDYLITASAANGEQTKTIHKKYSQETSDS
ncbi:ABC-type phosphate transport system, periplasmic component [Cylindrospermum stagnale PCC 7417]|uniref:ABC-type phosphate transport system, periplasmic component n=1 Tax=Cylindrospermum stagnale PCC 7417 TaxID=56107 RepID=K9WVW2_9NOST|nr:substrate-binding domain-containing protein [Cylindrospermum stagnale]AFZ24353.1 ABC-type phosphate transport system, periplasmic component [Cylindrospermum stagnale PCC 7417]